MSQEPYRTPGYGQPQAGGASGHPARGGPDPGPEGFEISAEGDLDGDADLSLFVPSGTVNAATHQIELARIFVVDEAE